MLADFGGGGSPVPMAQHPMWQGSVSSKWMDAASGAPRCRIIVESYCRNGTNGISTHGLGGYFTDSRGKLREENLQGKAFVPEAPQKHSDEFVWRSSRRTCSHPTVFEPERLTASPPFVPRRGSTICHTSAASLPPVYNAAAELYHRSQGSQRERQVRRVAMQEDKMARTMVLGLDDWEREHLQRDPPRRSSSQPTGFTQRNQTMPSSKTSALSWAKAASAGMPHWRSPSDTHIEFSRRSVA
mmetsp:Transcript_121433/g.388341  ORF Transcript_121433/g.388341 Transcript_121433/m.388341 type:complete len:242 (-) Transcript_121433:67-792(-)|eukprot:CAMPEP_0203909226 /NCGR_PEP_ID=MMETSP0359-20131031/50547_1 /ASSEMBLY_ACC=CAM_ASM_000338 /TAXON_ID=268821 /ORGANISM="Scrippsiella Hangoei, Strain SHTV-5" /LENGTH=241 /DNA_ID=CAMNT_0050834415 /DNA_START=40 /DNA_END=765 /DNA_ORIENTATION=-